MENADSGLFFKMQNARPSFLYTRDLLMVDVVVVFAVVLPVQWPHSTIQKSDTMLSLPAAKRNPSSLKVDNEKSRGAGASRPTRSNMPLLTPKTLFKYSIVAKSRTNKKSS